MSLVDNRLDMGREIHPLLPFRLSWISLENSLQQQQTRLMPIALQVQEDACGREKQERLGSPVLVSIA